MEVRTGHRRPDRGRRRVDRERARRRASWWWSTASTSCAPGSHGAGADARTVPDARRSGRRRMNPSRPFILRPIATSLLMAAHPAGRRRRLPPAAGLGAAAGRLPDHPGADVLSRAPSPDVMASSVTAPLERQFGQVPGLNQMTSTSSVGSSVITLQFALDLNIDVAEQEVQAAINAAVDLPADGPAEPADLQQDQSGRRADPDAGADLDRRCRSRRSRTSPTPGWRRRSRSCPASAWSASAAARSRRCASRPTRPRWPRTASASRTCAPRSRRPT